MKLVQYTNSACSFHQGLIIFPVCSLSCTFSFFPLSFPLSSHFSLLRLVQFFNFPSDLHFFPLCHTPLNHFFPLSHSDLQSTWNWFLCIVWIRDQDSDFSICMANWPSTIYWKSHSFCVALLWHLFYKLGVLTCVDLFLSSQCCFTGLFIFLVSKHAPIFSLAL